MQKIIINNKKAILNIWIFGIFLFLVLILPTFAHSAGLVPDCNKEIDKASGFFSNPCGYKELMEMVQTVIDFILFKISMPIAAIMFAYAGFLLLTSGGSEEKHTKAKEIFFNVGIGFVIALAAWLIVSAILWGLGIQNGFSFLEEIG